MQRILSFSDKCAALNCLRAILCPGRRHRLRGTFKRCCYSEQMEMGFLSITSNMAESKVDDLSVFFDIESGFVDIIDRDIKFCTEIRQNMVQSLKESQMKLLLPTLAAFGFMIYPAEILLFQCTLAVLKINARGLSSLWQ